MNVYIDIETIPTDRDDVRKYIAATVTHPANISKAETIAKWNEESRPGAVEEAIAKTSLDGAFGRVLMVGVALDDGPVMILHTETERGILTQLAGLLETIPANEKFTTCMIGHNECAFDLRFLTQRYMVNGIKLPMVLSRAVSAKPWESDKVFDTMVQWAGTGNRVSLEKLCLALGIDSPKSEITGATVWKAYQDGRIDDLKAYCKGDVEAVRKVHKRMTFSTEADFQLMAA